MNHQLGDCSAGDTALHRVPQTIVIVRSLPGLGDLLCCVPTLRALRSAFPNSSITLIGLPGSQGFVQRFPHYLNHWLEFPGFPGIPEVVVSPQKVVKFLAQAQAFHFDLALQLHGSGSFINSFVMLLGARQTAGFFPATFSCPDPQTFFPYPDHEPEIWRNLRLLEGLGISLQGDHLEFPLDSADWLEWKTICATHGLAAHSYICLHPGASVSARRWGYEAFAAVGDALAAQGWQIVLTGTTAELELTQAVAQTMRFPAINLAGCTSLGAIAALLKQSRLLICNDTGVSHLATALSVPSVVIFSDSDPHRWAPLDRKLHRIIQRSVGGDIDATVLQQVLREATDLLHPEFAYAS